MPTKLAKNPKRIVDNNKIKVKFIKYESEMVISKILSEINDILEYCINPHPRPIAILVPIKDSNTASKIKGNLMYVEEAPTVLIILISFFLA